VTAAVVWLCYLGNLAQGGGGGERCDVYLRGYGVMKWRENVQDASNCDKQRDGGEGTVCAAV